MVFKLKIYNKKKFTLMILKEKEQAEMFEQPWERIIRKYFKKLKVFELDVGQVRM